MSRQTQTPEEQTAEICDEIRDELGLEEHKGHGRYTLTQTEKRTILQALRD